MLDAHAHIGDINHKDGLVCSATPEEVPTGYRFNSIGLIPCAGTFDIGKLELYASKGYMIGEIGLDRRYPDLDRQLSLFKSILSIARTYDRFVTIHMVGCQEAIYDAIKESKIRTFLLHGYTGSVEMARRFISIGGLISINPRAEKAKSFPDLLKLPFVTETDMEMGEIQNKTLTAWNEKLSQLTGFDVQEVSERRLLERIYV